MNVLLHTARELPTFLAHRIIFQMEARAPEARDESLRRAEDAEEVEFNSVRLGIETRLADMTPQVVVQLLGKATEHLKKMGRTDLADRLDSLNTGIVERKQLSDIARRTAKVLKDVEVIRQNSRDMEETARKIDRGISDLETTLEAANSSAIKKMKV